MISDPEPLNPLNSIGVMVAADCEEDPLPAQFWGHSDIPSPWNTYWMEATAYEGGLELDDPAFGNRWTKYWGAHSWFDSDPEFPCECEGHNCLGTHSTEGHAPAAAAATAKLAPVPLIVIEPPTPTPLEIEAYNWHWLMCLICCDVRIRTTRPRGSGAHGRPGHRRRNRQQEPAGDRLWGETDISGKRTGGVEDSGGIHRTGGHGAEGARPPSKDIMATEADHRSTDPIVPTSGRPRYRYGGLDSTIGNRSCRSEQQTSGGGTQ